MPNEIKCQKCCEHNNLVHIKETGSVQCKDCNKTFYSGSGTTNNNYPNYNYCYPALGANWQWNGYRWVWVI